MNASQSKSSSSRAGRDNRCYDESFLADCDERIREIHTLWKAKCGGDALPSRRDLQPREMLALLPNIMLLDVVWPGPRFRYSLVGTGEVAHRGMDPTGKWLEDAYSGLDGDYCDGNYRYVATTGKPLFDNSQEPTALGNLADVQAVFLPLARDGRTVDTIMVYSLVEMVTGDSLKPGGRNRRK